MAAPTISASNQNASLNKLLAKESATKLTHKNLLIAGSQEWPRPAKSVEDSILTKLEEKLKTLPNVFKSTKVSSHEDNSEKARVRSQLEIGTSSVFRALEQDALACVLVSGQATPAIAVDHIISLGRERGCPLLCLDQLAPTVAKATESKCHPLTLGFKKLADHSQSDFAEVISLVVENTKVTGPLYGNTRAMVVPDKDTVETRGGTVIKENKFRPLRVAADVEKEILQELERWFSEAQTVTVDQGKKKKKKQKKKKNLKEAFDHCYHPLFEIGKRTVTDILERGKLQLILISQKIAPALVSEPQSFSLLSVAAEKKCPVLVIPGMDDTMRTISGGCISVLGFKKMSPLQESGHKDFVRLIEKCLHAVRNLGETVTVQPGGMKTTPQDSSVSKPAQDENTLPSHVESTVTSQQKGYSKEKEGSAAEEEEEDEDYSYLYILKKDSKAYAEMKSNLSAEAESTAKSATFSADFIAFSANIKGKHSSQPVAVSSVSDPPESTKDSSSRPSIGAQSALSSQLSTHSAPDFSAQVPTTSKSSSSALPLFSLCRSGTPLGGKGVVEKSSSKPAKSEAVKTDSVVLGMEELPVSSDKKTKGIDFLSFTDSGKNAKKAMKRKLGADDSFISFTYTEANIKTMTSNPSKKRKKKKNK